MELPYFSVKRRVSTKKSRPQGDRFLILQSQVLVAVTLG